MLEDEAGDIERKTWFVVAHFERFDKEKMAPDTSGVFCALLATDRAAADHSTFISTFLIHAVVDDIFLLQERERAHSKGLNRYIDSGDIIAFSLHLATPQSSRGPRTIASSSVPFDRHSGDIDDFRADRETGEPDSLSFFFEDF